MVNTIDEIREELIEDLESQRFVIDKTGVKLIEIVGASFVADEPYIFRKPSREYIRRELEWYESMSLNVNDIPGDTPDIWKSVSDKNGLIHSNYGYLVHSKENNFQYGKCLNQLLHDEQSRRAVMIYTRPSIQDEYDRDGMSDFICTNTVQYLIRDGALHAVVQMRSNDVVFGYNNDWAWQYTVLNSLVKDYNAYNSDEYHIEAGQIVWQVGSLHVYERHFKYVK